MRADQFTDPITDHGEGPVWWPDGHLRCVDMLAGDLVDLMPDGSVSRTHVGEVAAAVRPRVGGGAVVAVERGLVLIDADDTITRLPELWTDHGVRMNEGGCDPDGRFYCGSMAYDLGRGRGALYRFDADGAPTVVLSGVSVSNGFAFSPDGATAYYVDTPTRRIDAFDYDTDRGLSQRRPWAVVPDDGGKPDGITVDRDGGVWVACWGGGAVRRYVDGMLVELIEVPDAIQVSACTLGGDALDRLFITTSRHGLAPEQAGDAGSIFVVDDVVPGLQVIPARM